MKKRLFVLEYSEFVIIVLPEFETFSKKCPVVEVQVIATRAAEAVKIAEDMLNRAEYPNNLDLTDIRVEPQILGQKLDEA